MRSIALALLGLLALASVCSAAERKVTLTVEAGNYDRRETIVTFPITEDMKDLRYAKQGDALFALQVDGTNATFRLGLLPNGTTTNFTLHPQDSPDIFGARPHREKSKLVFDEIWAGPNALLTNRLFEFQAEAGALPRAEIKELFTRGGYLHPFRTPRGRMVTDDFPPNHIHHHGVWWAWTKTEFDGRHPDFWNMGDGKGRVDFVALDAQWGGSVHGGFRSRQDFVDLTGPKPAVALHETWQVTAFPPHGGREHWLLDLVSEQTCATPNPLMLPKYHYGGVGLRGNRAWNGATNVNFLTSDGVTDRIKGNTQNGRWCDMWGRIDGADAGFAILCHPANFRAPQPMRLHPTEPFFCYAPQQAGGMEIKPGEPYVSRYRFVIHDGPPDRAELDRLWNDYAHPPVARVKVSP